VVVFIFVVVFITEVFFIFEVVFIFEVGSFFEAVFIFEVLMTSYVITLCHDVISHDIITLAEVKQLSVWSFGQRNITGK